MTADEVANAIQLYLDGALLKEIAAEFGRHVTTIEKLVARSDLKRGHKFRTRGPRGYLVNQVLVRHFHAEIDWRNIQ